MRSRARGAGLLGAAVLVGAACSVASIGCESHGSQAGGDAAPDRGEPLPADEAADVVERYNARIERLERLWARLTIVADGVDAEGSPFREQGEGHLQVARPDHVALTIGKLGDTRLYLGSNEERYWWIDVIDPSRKTALVGTHADATPDKTARLGMPVQPLDLVELLGVLPMPADGVRAVRRRDAEGEPFIGVVFDRVRSGAQVFIELDPANLEPRRISIVVPDPQRPAAPFITSAKLDRYQIVTVNDDRRARPRVATRFLIHSVVTPGVVRVALYDPENRPIRDIAFDLDRLLRAYRVEDVIDLDDDGGIDRAADAMIASPSLGGTGAVVGGVVGDGDGAATEGDSE
ncbi:MAG: hypothetical protein AAF235_04560 [Planctomycetota bacterium]